MTTKYIGEISLEGNRVKMPTCTNIPAKREWNHFAIWNFNGKVWNPASRLAEENLAAVVKQLEANGFTGATKPGKLKKSTLKYAIQTTGVEEFTLV